VEAHHELLYLEEKLTVAEVETISASPQKPTSIEGKPSTSSRDHRHPAFMPAVPAMTTRRCEKGAAEDEEDALPEVEAETRKAQERRLPQVDEDDERRHGRRRSQARRQRAGATTTMMTDGREKDKYGGNDARTEDEKPARKRAGAKM